MQTDQMRKTTLSKDLSRIVLISRLYVRQRLSAIQGGSKSKLVYCCNNFVYCYNLWQIYTVGNLQLYDT